VKRIAVPPKVVHRLAVVAGYADDPLVIIIAAARAAWPKVDVGVCVVCFVVCVVVYTIQRKRHVTRKDEKAEEKEIEADICKECHLRKKCFEEHVSKGETVKEFVEKEIANV
jgi:hypothetical protein